MLLKICIGLINFYQTWLSFDRGLLRFLAPGGACKFYPSCSQYTKEMMLKHGVWRGGLKGLGQFLRCW